MKSNFLNTLRDAQLLAFSPFIFQATHVALDSGLLAYIVESKTPVSEESIESAIDLSAYGIGVIVDLLVPAGILQRNEKRELSGTKLAEVLLYDDMTRANFEFTQAMNYAGLANMKASLYEGRPAGLEVFNPEWKTIYPYLPELPEEAKKSWFRFDHFHSDRAYHAALEILKTLNPQHLVDIGANTGRFTRLFLDTFPEARAYFVDLPAQTEAVKVRDNFQPYKDRIELVNIDWLSDAPLLGTKEGDLYWMSQFLDCFSFDEAVSILKRTKKAMKPGASLAVLECIVDEQRHEVAELSLAATNLYFSVMANGNSRFFNGETLRKIFKEAGFTIVTEKANLGISHTLFILK